ncbi:MAG: hypothetical protein Kow00109_06780 [Acidobacteriota bacterium]
MNTISIKQLLEAGVHFGHQTSRWNPKMREYIFGERNDIHIIDLQKTMKCFREAIDFLTDVAARGGEVLFVGTKRQAQEVVEEEAIRCGMHYVTNRWLGGLLTNFATVRNSVKRYLELEALRQEGYQTRFTSKKEISKIERERRKLEKNLKGIVRMEKLPDALVVIDTDHEIIAVREANRLGIPVVGVVDTNGDPDLVDYIVPGNDDALRSIKLFASAFADAILAGRAIWETKLEEERKAREEAARLEAERQAAARAAAEARKAEKAAAEAAKKAAAKAAAEAAKAAAQESEGGGVEAPAAQPAAVSPEAKAAAEAEAPATEQKAAEEAPAAEVAEKAAPRKRKAKPKSEEASPAAEESGAAAGAEPAATEESAAPEDAPAEGESAEPGAPEDEEKQV